MIYQCYSCSKTSFKIICPWCSGGVPTASASWGTKTPTPIASGQMIPLPPPSFYPDLDDYNQKIIEDFI